MKPERILSLIAVSAASWLLVGCAHDQFSYRNPPLGNFQPIDIREYQLTAQPVQDYRISFEEPDDTCQNSARYYTRIGTNYGLMGPEQQHIEPVLPAPRDPQRQWDTEGVHVHLYQDLWAGMWHQLRGLAPKPDKLPSPAPEKLPSLNLGRSYPAVIESNYQPKVVGAYVRVKGDGRMKLELKARDNEAGGKEYIRPLQWIGINLDSPQLQTVVWLWQSDPKLNHVITVSSPADLDIPRVRDAVTEVMVDPPVALLNWVVEDRGSDLTVDEIGLVVAFPRIKPAAKRFFVKSLAKLALCYADNPDVPDLALVRDRANFPPGDMDSTPASGMFCLALAAGWSEGLVDKDKAVEVLNKVHRTVADTRFARDPKTGLLAHLVTWSNKRYIPSPRNKCKAKGKPSEYSTIDTALYYHGMLLAAEILGERQVAEELRGQICRINWDGLMKRHNEAYPDPNAAMARYVPHGVDSGTGTPIKYTWRDWGGETALVLCLMKMATDKHPFVMDDPSYEFRYNGKPVGVHCGRGFIAEIQSLFYPDFNDDRSDKLTQQNWLQIRRNLLEAQVGRTKEVFPDTKAAQNSLYGYSSGEEIHDPDNYLANGLWVKTDDRKLLSPRPVLFPHYILMSACVANDTRTPITALECLERQGLFPPWGLVENFDVDMKRSMGFIGSLNASFEAIAAYHLLCAAENHRGRDVIYNACHSSPTFRKAISIFYPGPGTLQDPQAAGVYRPEGLPFRLD